MCEESPPEKTVYFLGAGASNDSDFSLPTMQGFFRENEPNLEKFPHLHHFVKKAFPKIHTEELNLEDVITYLDLSVDRFGSFGIPPVGYLYDARTEFEQYIKKKLDYEDSSDKIWCSKLKRVFQKLNRTDTVITLNYDLIIENTLNSLSKEQEGRDNHPLYDIMVNLLIESTIYDVSILRGNWDDGLYLKLHGSIDWYCCPHRDCRNHPLVEIPEKTKRNSPHFCSVCGSSLKLAIVPPVMNKVFQEYPKLGVMWTLARHEVMACTCIVFIGVSFAPSDYYLRWLIKSSFVNPKSSKKSVVVIDECPSVKEKIKEMVGIEPIYYFSIEEYIEKGLDKK